MKTSQETKGLETGKVKFFDTKKRNGIIAPDDGNHDVLLENSPIELHGWEEVEFMVNGNGFVTHISTGRKQLLEVLTLNTLDLDKKYLWKDYEEIANKYWEIINKTFEYENSSILRISRNLTQEIHDEKNYELAAFLTKFVKATLPEAFKNLIDVKGLKREEIRAKIPDDIYDKFVDNKKIQQIMDDFISVMLKKFPKTFYTHTHSKEWWITLHAYKEIGSYIWMTLNCYMNNIDPAILESTPEEIRKRNAESVAYFEKHKKRMPFIVNNREKLENALNDIIKNEEDKRNALNPN